MYLEVCTLLDTCVHTVTAYAYIVTYSCFHGQVVVGNRSSHVSHVHSLHIVHNRQPPNNAHVTHTRMHRRLSVTNPYGDDDDDWASLEEGDDPNDPPAKGEQKV